MKLRRSLILLSALLLAAPSARALDNDLALTPPMGFNPWNMFGENFTELVAKQMMDSLISKGLKDSGYSYFCLDAFGNKYGTNPTTEFPSGMVAFGQYVHNKGFRFGCYGPNGAVGQESQWVANWVLWKVDYVKYDAYNYAGDHPTWATMRTAIMSCGRPMALSIHFQGGPGECSLPAGLAGLANLWRTSNDICGVGGASFSTAATGCKDYPGSVCRNLDYNAARYADAGPGHWNDPDMLAVGMPGLSDAESRAHFSLWCVMAAPLMIGADVRNITPTALAILKNGEAIRVDQDGLGIQGRKVRDDGDHELFVKPMKDSGVAVVMFNRGASSASMSFTLQEIGIAATRAKVRDLWAHADKGETSASYSATVGAHDVVMLRLWPARNTGASRVRRAFMRSTQPGATVVFYDLRGGLIPGAQCNKAMGRRLAGGIYPARMVVDQRMAIAKLEINR